MYELVLVGRVVLFDKEFGKAYDGRYRRTDFVTHIAQERVLHALHLLGLGFLALQLLSGSHLGTHVATHTEIAVDIPILVIDGSHVEL